MEENKSKKSEGVSLVALTIIVILMIGLAVNIAYILKTRDQEVIINNNNGEQTINELRTEIESLKKTIAQKDNIINNKLSRKCRNMARS